MVRPQQRCKHTLQSQQSPSIATARHLLARSFNPFSFHVLPTNGALILPAPFLILHCAASCHHPCCGPASSTVHQPHHPHSPAPTARRPGPRIPPPPRARSHPVSGSTGCSCHRTAAVPAAAAAASVLLWCGTPCWQEAGRDTAAAR